MKIVSLLIAISFLANVALAVKWRQTQLVRNSTAAISPASSAAPASVPAKPPEAAGDAKGEKVSTAAPASPARVTWAQLFAADDLKGSIRRLRAVGCPEETIQDLVVAEVTRRFADRRRLALTSTNENAYWKATDYDSAESMARSRQYRELSREQSALLVELLGYDPQKKQREEGGIFDYSESRVSFLPPEKREPVARFLEEFQEKENEHYRRNRGMMDAQERAERKQLQAEKIRGLSALLTPEELRQWELRAGPMASQVQSEITCLTLTEKEYQAIFDARKKVGDAIYFWSDQVNDPQARARSEEAKKQLQDDLKAALGEGRAKEYEWSRNYDYQQLFRMAKTEGLPADTPQKVYGFKEAAEAKAKEIRAMQDWSREQQQAALAAVRTETEAAVSAALGATAYNKYKANAYWLNSISYVPRPRIQPATQP